MNKTKAKCEKLSSSQHGVKDEKTQYVAVCVPDRRTSSSVLNSFALPSLCKRGLNFCQTGGQTSCLTLPPHTQHRVIKSVLATGLLESHQKGSFKTA